MGSTLYLGSSAGLHHQFVNEIQRVVVIRVTRVTVGIMDAIVESLHLRSLAIGQRADKECPGVRPSFPLYFTLTY